MVDGPRIWQPAALPSLVANKIQTLNSCAVHRRTVDESGILFGSWVLGTDSSQLHPFLSDFQACCRQYKLYWP